MFNQSKQCDEELYPTKTFENNHGKKGLTYTESQSITRKVMEFFIENEDFRKYFTDSFVVYLNAKCSKEKINHYFDFLLRNGSQLVGIDIKNPYYSPSGLTINVMIKSNVPRDIEIKIRDVVYETFTYFQRKWHMELFEDNDNKLIQRFRNLYIRNFTGCPYVPPFLQPQRSKRKNHVIYPSKDSKCSTDMSIFPTFTPLKQLIHSPLFCSTNIIIGENQRNFEIVRMKLNHTTMGSKFTSCPANLINVVIMYNGDIERKLYFTNKNKHQSICLYGLNYYLASTEYIKKSKSIKYQIM